MSNEFDGITSPPAGGGAYNKKGDGGGGKGGGGEPARITPPLPTDIVVAKPEVESPSSEPEEPPLSNGGRWRTVGEELRDRIQNAPTTEERAEAQRQLDSYTPKPKQEAQFGDTSMLDGARAYAAAGYKV